MKFFVYLAFLISVNIIFSACSNEIVTQPATINDDDDNDPPGLVDDGNFRLVLHGSVTEAQERSIRDSLENNCERIKTHLRVSDMPTITVAVWARSSSTEFYSVMENRLGQVFPGATGFTPSYTEMFMLYSSTTPTETVHEYAHLVSMQLNPSISNNPRWLWEAVAQYESRMFDHPSTWAAYDLNWPGFASLNYYNSVLPYRWGYFISSFIIQNWGDDEYVRLIELNGDINTVLGITPVEFGERVEQFVRNIIN